MSDISVNIKTVGAEEAKKQMGYVSAAANEFSNKLTSKLTGMFSAVAIGAMVFDKIGDAMSKNMATAKQIGGLSTKFNIDPKEVHSLMMAANDAGVAVRTLLQGMKTLGTFANKAIVDKSKADVFRQMGLDMDKLATLAKKPAASLGEISVGLMRISNDQDRARVGQQLLGRQYQQMLPLIEKLGTDARARAEYLDNENAMTKEQVEQNKEVARMQSVMNQQWEKLIADLTPLAVILTGIVKLCVDMAKFVGQAAGYFEQIGKKGAAQTNDYMAKQMKNILAGAKDGKLSEADMKDLQDWKKANPRGTLEEWAAKRAAQYSEGDEIRGDGQTTTYGSRMSRAMSKPVEAGMKMLGDDLGLGVVGNVVGGIGGAVVGVGTGIHESFSTLSAQMGMGRSTSIQQDEQTQAFNERAMLAQQAADDKKMKARAAILDPMNAKHAAEEAEEAKKLAEAQALDQKEAEEADAGKDFSFNEKNVADFVWQGSVGQDGLWTTKKYNIKSAVQRLALNKVRSGSAMGVREQAAKYDAQPAELRRRSERGAAKTEIEKIENAPNDEVMQTMEQFAATSREEYEKDFDAWIQKFAKLGGGYNETLATMGNAAGMDIWYDKKTGKINKGKKPQEVINQELIQVEDTAKKEKEDKENKSMAKARRRAERHSRTKKTGVALAEEELGDAREDLKEEDDAHKKKQAELKTAQDLKTANDEAIKAARAKYKDLFARQQKGDRTVTAGMVNDAAAEVNRTEGLGKGTDEDLRKKLKEENDAYLARQKAVDAVTSKEKGLGDAKMAAWAKEKAAQDDLYKDRKDYENEHLELKYRNMKQAGKTEDEILEERFTDQMKAYEEAFIRAEEGEAEIAANIEARQLAEDSEASMEGREAVTIEATDAEKARIKQLREERDKGRRGAEDALDAIGANWKPGQAVVSDLGKLGGGGAAQFGGQNPVDEIKKTNKWLELIYRERTNRDSFLGTDSVPHFGKLPEDYTTTPTYTASTPAR